MKITNITTYRLPPRWMFLKIELTKALSAGVSRSSKVALAP